MALYREIYEISEPISDFTQINLRLKEHTGLDSELEIITATTAVFSSIKFKTDIEVDISNKKRIQIFFSPGKRKNYYENSFLYVLSNYMPPNLIKIPKHTMKKWNELTLIEKYIKG